MRRPPIFPISSVEGNKITSLNGNLARFFAIHPPDLEQLTDHQIQNFFASVATILNGLNPAHYFKYYQLGGRGYLETNGNNFQLPGVRFSPCNNPLETFFGGEELFSNVLIFDDYINYNGKYTRIISVKEFEENTLSTTMPTDVDSMLCLKRMSPDKAKKFLERVRSGHMAGFLKSKRDIEGEGSYAQAEELLQELIYGHESLFTIELFFILTASSLEDLNGNTTSFCSKLSLCGINPFVEGHSFKNAKSGLPSIFGQLIPGVPPTLGLREHVDKTSHLCYLLPLHRSHLMNRGIPLLGQNGERIFFDPFAKELKNSNLLVSGASGGGKSVFVNKLVHHLVGKHPTVILDKGGSFKRLALYHGGKVLDQGFNPLQFRDPLYLREFILSVVDKEAFGKLERGRLLKEIKRALYECTTFDGLLDKLEECYPDISYYFEDIKEFFTDKSIPPNNILYVDIDQFPRSITAPLIIWPLEYFKNIPHPHKVLVIDECWSFLQNHADYIDECFRTFRKSGALPIAISQGICDFEGIAGTLGASIANNCHTKAYFPQEIDSSNDIDTFDQQQIQGLSFEKGVYAECYLKSSDNTIRKVVRIALSPLEYELFQTNAGEGDRLNAFLEKYGEFFDSPKQAIEAFVRLRCAEQHEISKKIKRSKDDTNAL